MEKAFRYINAALIVLASVVILIQINSQSRELRKANGKIESALYEAESVAENLTIALKSLDRLSDSLSVTEQKLDFIIENGIKPRESSEKTRGCECDKCECKDCKCGQEQAAEPEQVIPALPEVIVPQADPSIQIIQESPV